MSSIFQKYRDILRQKVAQVASGPRLNNFASYTLPQVKARIASSPYLNRVANRATNNPYGSTPLSPTAIGHAVQGTQFLSNIANQYANKPNTPGFLDDVGRMTAGTTSKLLKVGSYPLKLSQTGSQNMVSGSQNIVSGTLNKNLDQGLKGAGQLIGGAGQLVGGAGAIYYGGKTLGSGGVKGIASRALQGAGLNLAIGTGAQLLTGGGLPTKEQAKKYLQSGVENSWTLAFTGGLTDKVLSKFAPTLVGNAITTPFRNGEVAQGLKQVFMRALAEVPAENTAFTWLNRLDEPSKRTFMEDWMLSLPGSVTQNLISAAGQGSFEILRNKESRKAVSDVLQETIRKWNTPVTTMKLDASGKRIKMPMWKYEWKKNQPGGLTTKDINELSIEDYAKQKGITVKEAEAEFKQKIESPPISKVKSRMDLTETGKQTVDNAYLKIKNEMEKIAGRPITHKEVLKMAQATQSNLIKTLGRNETLKQEASLVKLGQEINELANTGTVTEEMVKKLKQYVTSGTNTARLLEIRKQQLEPTTPQGRMITQYLENILKVNNDLNGVLKASKGVNWDDAESVGKFYRQFVQPSLEDWADKVRYNAMLSSPKTQIVNISSNLQGTGMLYPIQKEVEGIVDIFHSALTGSDRTRYLGEGIEYAKGYYGNIGSAWNDFVSTVKRNNISENPDFRNIPLAEKGTGLRLWDDILSSPGLALEAFDKFFRNLTETGLERSSAYRTEASGGKIPMSSSNEITAKAEKLLFRAPLDTKGEGVVSDTLTAGARWVAQARYSKNKYFRYLAKMTFPFINIGTNLAKAGVEGNPVLGTANLVGNKEKTEAVAKLVMGGVFTAIGSAMALGGKLTGQAPTDPTKKKAFYDANMKPWSVKVGDNWISYDKLHPLIAFQLATAASIAERLKNGSITDDSAEKIMGGLANGLRFFADQTYFRNLSDFVDLVQGNSLSPSRMIANYPSQFIPFRALMGWATRLVDKYQRQPDTNSGLVTQVVQNITSQIPGLSTTVPKRLNTFGMPVENQNRLANAFLPVNVSTENKAFRNIYELRSSNYQYNQLKKQLDTFIEQGNKEGAINLLKNNKEVYLKGKLASKIVEDMSVYKKVGQRISTDTRLTDAQKEAALKKLKLLIEEKYGKINENYLQ